MTKSISAAAASSIEAAISRLMGSGDVQTTFTIARLASEAGLARHSTGRRNCSGDSGPPWRRMSERRRVRRQARIASTSSKPRLPPCAAETEELRALRLSNRNMAQHIQALSLLVRQQEQRIARLQAEPSEPGRAVTLVALAAAPRR
jgi:hypothetical protein